MNIEKLQPHKDQEVMHYREIKLNAFRIVMSRGDDIPFDEDELKKVWDSITTGRPAKLKQGIFNPSFYVSIIQDEQRVVEILNENARAYEHNMHDMKYNGGNNQTEYKQLKPLKDIFAECKHLPEAMTKQLTN